MQLRVPIYPNKTGRARPLEFVRIEELRMQYREIRAAAHKAGSVGKSIAGLLLAISLQPAFAQSTAAAAASGTAPSEAAQRAAQSPYRFILLNSQPSKPKPAAAPAPAVEAKKPAAPEQTAILSRPAPAPSAAPSAPAPEPTPVAVAAPQAPEPVPAKELRREIIPVKTEPPRLTAALMREQPNGTVKVHFDINPDGSTGNVKVVSSSNRSLNRASVDAVSAWKFQQIDETATVETELVYNLNN